MFSSKPRFRPSLGAVGAVTGCLALFFSVGGQFVFAHGGDDTKIHACVNDITGEVQIIADPTGYGDPNAACSGGQTHALDWNGIGVTGPAGPPGPSGTSAPPDPAARAGAIVEKLPPGRKLSKLTHGKVKLFKQSVGPSVGSSKSRAVECPSSNPDVLEGGALAFAHLEAFSLGVGGLVPAIDIPWPVAWVYNHALSHGWTAYALQDDVGVADLVASGIRSNQPWTLTVWVKCSVRNKGLVHHKP